MSGKRTSVSKPDRRRRFTREFKEAAVQMLLDGHTAESVASRLGLKGTQCRMALSRCKLFQVHSLRKSALRMFLGFCMSG